MAKDLAPLQRALLVSATRKLQLSVAGIGVGVGLLASLLHLGGHVLPSVILALGLLAYAALIALDVSNPAFIRRANSRLRVSDENALASLDPKALRDPVIRDVYVGILASMNECRRVYGSTSPSLRASLEDGMRRSEELVVVAARAAKRSDAIRRHLDGYAASEIDREIERLSVLARKTDDETARGAFLQARDAKVKELETYGQLEGLRDRIHAQLELIEASLDGLSAKLVKLDASDLTEAVSINESITAHAQTMTYDVEILESSYDETLRELTHE